MIKLTNCLECGGTLVRAKIDVTNLSLAYPLIVEIKDVPVSKCANCGRKYGNTDTEKFLYAEEMKVLRN